MQNLTVPAPRETRRRTSQPQDALLANLRWQVTVVEGLYALPILHAQRCGAGLPSGPAIGAIRTSGSERADGPVTRPRHPQLLLVPLTGQRKRLGASRVRRRSPSHVGS